MSDEQQPVAAEAVQDTSGAASVETAQAEGSSAAEGTAANAQEIDKSWQSRHDRLLSEIGEARAYIKAYGGNGVAGFLKQFESVLGNPTLGPLVQQLLKTGSVEFPKPKNEWEEPVQEPEWKSAMNPLLQELQSLKGEITSLRSQSGMQRITQHTQAFLKEYPLTDEERALFASAVDEKLSSFATNANGAAILQNMDYKTYKSIALPEIEDHLERILARKTAKAKAQVAQKATDAPGMASGAKEIKPNGPAPRSVEELRRNVRKAFSEGLLNS
jgi:hypothetical protein